MQYTVYVGIALVLLSLLGIAFCLLRKNEPFFCLRDTVAAHLKIFKHCPGQYFVFYFLPLCFSVGLTMIYQAGERFYSELSIVLGILLSILLAILSILGSYDFSSIKDEGQKTRGKAVIKSTINAIIFDSMLCLFMLLYGLVIIVLSGGSYNTIPSMLLEIIKAVASGMAYYIFSVILLTLLLIIKQLSKLIEFSLEVKRKE